MADWAAVGDDDDVNGFYGGEKRQRGGRKKRKKTREEQVVLQDWDDIYDPTRPNNYEEYKHSDEKIREVRDWKDRLYAHRMARKAESDKSSDDEGVYRPALNSKTFNCWLLVKLLILYTDQFAPPPSYSFAPPPIDPPQQQEARPKASVEDVPYSSKFDPTLTPPPPPPSDPVPALPVAPHLPPPKGSISRAPVRYNLPAAPSDIPASEAELQRALAAEPEEADEEEAEDAPKSNRPGQKGFAERLMSKYGWTKGTGLGADGSGITSALRVQVEKRKKKSDAEGGGFREPGARGKIIGGHKKVPDKEPEVGKFGPMSEVIVLRGMVDGMDLDEEVEGAEDGGIMQEIGEECAEKVSQLPVKGNYSVEMLTLCSMVELTEYTLIGAAHPRKYL